MCCITVPQPVKSNALLYPCLLYCHPEHFLNTRCTIPAALILPFKKINNRAISTDIQIYHLNQLCRNRNNPVLETLRLPDTQKHPVTINILRLKRNYLTSAQPASVNNTQYRPVLLIHRG